MNPPDCSICSSSAIQYSQFNLLAFPYAYNIGYIKVNGKIITQ